VVKDILDELSDVETRKAIEEAGLDAEKVTHPFGIKRENIASTEQSAGSILGMILPFMLVVSLLMGTMYPAIDTTAGEKERGTLETLLTLPIRNHEMILAKFITIRHVFSILLSFCRLILIAIQIIRVTKQLTNNQLVFIIT
jgi:sodium transport system permease protein